MGYSGTEVSIMKFVQQFIISLLVSVVVTVLLIGPHSAEEYDRAPGAIIIGLLVLIIMIIIMRRSKSTQEFINEKITIVSILLSFVIFCVVAFASRSYILGVLTAFLVIIMLIGPKVLGNFTSVLWNFALNRIRELSRAIQGKE